MTQSCVKRTASATQVSAIQNICWKNIYPVPGDVSIISAYRRKDIYSGRIERPTEWLTECIRSTKKKDDAHKTNVQ